MKKLLGVFAITLSLAACNSNNTDTAESTEKEGGCPFGFDKMKSSGQVLKSEGNTNKDWWPNQLNLDVLRQTQTFQTLWEKSLTTEKNFQA